MTTPQSVIDEWRPHREAIRPAGCDHRAGCWVVAPFEACADNRQGTPHCAACGARISAPFGAISQFRQRLARAAE